jgi:succinate dehydrogenase / fumarate reductase, membrane anchor subunit
MNGQPARSPLSRARDLGSAKAGAQHWWMQRLTAVALIPLTLWFMASLIALAGSDYSAVIVWLKAPFVTVLMVLLLIALFYHTALGIQVVIEDYIHGNRLKLASLVLIHLGCFALAVAGISAVLRIAFAV